MSEDVAVASPLPVGGATPTARAGFPDGVGRLAGALIVLGILLALLMGALDNFVVLTALPAILADLGQPSGTTFVISAYLISSTVAIPIFARLSDIYSRRNVFIAGLIIFIAGSTLAGVSQSLTQLVIFRAVQGFGSGGFFPVGIAMVAVLFPPETRARLTGLLSGVFGIATVAGPFLGSAIVDHFSWRWVFYVNIPIGIAGLVMLLLTLPALRPTSPGRFDVPGAALLAGWVASLMIALVQTEAYAFSQGGWAWTDARTLASITAAIVLVVGFVLWELRAKEPLVPLRLLAHRVVSASGGTTFLIGAVVFPLATFVSIFIGVVLAGSGTNAADTIRNVLYFLVIPLVIGATVGGQLLTRVGYRAIVAPGLVISGVGMFFLTTVTATTPIYVFDYGFLPVAGIALALIPVGFGAGLTFPVFLLAVQNEVPITHVGEASGLIQFLQSLGGSMGLTLLASFQAWRYGLVAPPASGASVCYPDPTVAACLDYLQQLKVAQVTAYAQVFLVMLILLGVAFLFAIFLRGRLPKGVTPSATDPA